MYHVQCHDLEEKQDLAVKVASPSNVWEWYVHARIKERLSADDRIRVLAAHELHVFGGGPIEGLSSAMSEESSSWSALLQDLGGGATMLDMVNEYRKQGTHVDELVAMHYTAVCPPCMNPLGTLTFTTHSPRLVPPRRY